MTVRNRKPQKPTVQSLPTRFRVRQGRKVINGLAISAVAVRIAAAAGPVAAAEAARARPQMTQMAQIQA